MYIFLFVCGSFNKLTDRFFKSSAWPEAETVAKVVHGGNVSCANQLPFVDSDLLSLIYIFKNIKIQLFLKSILLSSLMQ